MLHFFRKAKIARAGLNDSQLARPSILAQPSGECMQYAAETSSK
jgi:hypothetical protein